MEDEIIIRPAENKDITVMAELISLLFAIEQDFSVDMEKQRQGLATFFRYPEGRLLLVAECGKHVIGMCSAQLLVSTAEGGWKALVEDLVVAEAFRGRGVGERLLAAAREWAAGHDVKRLDLLADRDNTGGLRFYDRLQWQRTRLIALQKKIDVP